MVWIFVLLALWSASLVAQEPNWAVKIPHSSWIGVTAYDAARGQVVCFGTGGDTKVWEGTNWTQKNPASSPSPRSGHTMAYDADRGVVVLFGGTSISPLNDTWVWNGTSWTKQNPMNSPPPGSHAMTYDAARRRVLLFGGEETWVWDGVNWNKKSPMSSPPMGDYSMAFDSVRGQVVLFGGSQYVCETWEWDGTNWTKKIPMNSPPARVSHEMVFDAARLEIVLFGGLGYSSYLGDTWVWDGVNWRQKSSPSSPSPRYNASLSFDSARGQVVMFGGEEGGTVSYNETWGWDGSNWTKMSPVDSPPPGWMNAMAYDAARTEVVLLGGLVFARETWTWDGTKWIRKVPLANPTPRKYFSMAYDAAREQAVVFGGEGDGANLNDTWVWDGTDWAHRNPASSPSPRQYHRMAYDGARGQVVLFGGFASGMLNDTWIWDGNTWTQKSPSSAPTARVDHAMAYDAARGQVVLFGGSGSGMLNDTWVWDGTNWTQKTPMDSPPPSNGHSMAYDAARGHVVLFGGFDYNNEPADHTWLWDGTNWVKKSVISSPSPRFGTAIAYDALRGQVVLFGGTAGPKVYTDTWVWPHDGSRCWYTLSQSSVNVPSGLSTGFVTVTPSSQNCNWTATTQGGSWLQITSGLSGTGTGQIGYKVAANAGTEFRTAMIAVGGSVFVVTQEGSATAGTPFPLSATPRCWEGSTSYPAGPGVLLSWEAMGWPAKYEILRDHQVVATVTGNQFYNITGLTPGRTYSYQVRAVSLSSSLMSAQVAVVAPANCSTTSSLRVEELTLGKALLVGGESTAAKVRLSAAAPAGGAVVTLSSSNSIVSVPTTVTVPAGQTVGKFQVSTTSVQTVTVATLTATLGASNETVNVFVKPSAEAGTGVAYLFLHGLNSGPGTWKDLVGDRFGYCDRLKIVNTGNFLDPYQAQFDGQLGTEWLLGTIRFHKPSNGCYALGFGATGEWENGDGLNYFQLGQQVGAAVSLIWKQRKPSAIVFVGHSRGGLAARAFLQNLNQTTLYKKGLVTIGTPHLGSPLGRTKEWLDLNGYDWMDTWWLAGATAPGHLVAEYLKFMFSPSTGNLATTHDVNGVLDPNHNPALKHLNLQASALVTNVNAAGQIISKGLKLGDKIISDCNLFDYVPCTISIVPIPTSLAAFLPGDKTALENYVFQNVPASWKTDSDGIVPAESQDLNSVVAMNIAKTIDLSGIPHVEQTQKTDCINEVLDAVIDQPSMQMSEPPENQTKVRQLSEQTIITSTAEDSSQRLEQAEVVAARSKLLWLNEGGLVERAIKGIRLNSLEGLLSRQEMRQRGGESQRELFTQIERRLQSGESEHRVHAARLLAEVSAEHSAVALIGLVRGERDPEVRLSAMKALRSLAQDAATLDGRMLLSQELADLAGSSLESDMAALMAAVDGLVALGAAQDVERLVDLYKRAEQGQRKLIEARMGELRNGEGARRLAAFLEADPDVLQEETRLAGEVLSEVSTVESVSGLLAWAKDLTSEPLKADAVRWLGKIRSTRGKARLAEAVNQELFRSEELRQHLTQLLSSDAKCACAPAVEPQ